MKKVKLLGNYGKVTLDMTKLENIEKSLGRKLITRVGVLGKKATRQESGDAALNNPSIGLIHEKGSKSAGIPRRSFIEMPLELKMPRVLKELAPQVIEGLTEDNVYDAYRNLGIMGENVIQGAFATRGYGKWAPNAPATIRRKKSSAPLIDTAQLRKSITSDVREA